MSGRGTRIPETGQHYGANALCSNTIALANRLSVCAAQVSRSSPYSRSRCDLAVAVRHAAPRDLRGRGHHDGHRGTLWRDRLLRRRAHARNRRAYGPGREEPIGRWRDRWTHRVNRRDQTAARTLVRREPRRSPDCCRDVRSRRLGHTGGDMLPAWRASQVDPVAAIKSD